MIGAFTIGVMVGVLIGLGISILIDLISLKRWR
jgi:hypothetical protein